MAEQKTTSPLLGKMGAALVTAHMASKDKPADPGNVQLPGGIEGGVAEVVVCKFGKYEKGDNQGKDYFMASAVVQTPATHNVIDPITGQVSVVKVKGLHTKIGPMPLCDTTRKINNVPVVTPFADNYNAFLNELKLLDKDETIQKTPPPPRNAGESDKAYNDRAGAFIFNVICGVMKKITEGVKQKDGSVRRVYTRFRTWKPLADVIVQKGDKFSVESADGKKVHGVFPSRDLAMKAFPYAGKESDTKHYWQGAVDFSPNGTAASATEDSSTEEPDAQVEAPVVTTSDDTPAPDAPFDEFADDLDTLVQRASDEDEAVWRPAVTALGEKATAAGIEQIPDPQNPGQLMWPGADWEELAAMIKAATEGDDATATEEAPAEDEPFLPAIGEVYKYQQLDAAGKPLKNPKTKKAVPPIEIVVKTVNAAKQTITAVDNVSKKKAMPNIPFDALLSAE